MSAARSVNVTVADFFFGSLANFQHFHIKIEIHPGEGMIGIDRHLLEPDIGYGNHHTIVGVKLHTLFHFLIAKRGTRHLLDEPLVANTVTFFRTYLQFEFVSFFLAFQSFFHTGNQVAFAMEVVERVAAGAAIQYISAIVGERIMDRCDGVFGDFHEVDICGKVAISAKRL